MADAVTANIQAAAAVEQVAEPTTPTTSLLDSVIDASVAENEQRFVYAQRFGEAAAKSQYFDDAKSISQATMKIMAGYELGLMPVVSLMHIHIIKGKVGLDANLVATLLRKAGYTWKPLQQDDNGCELLFFRDGKMMTTLKRQGAEMVEVPLTVVFNRKHAEDADLTGPRGDKPKEKGMYEKYPRNMFFSRCITNFQKWHAPEVSNGITVHTVEELGGFEADSNGAAEPQLPRRKEEVPAA